MDKQKPMHMQGAISMRLRAPESKPARTTLWRLIMHRQLATLQNAGACLLVLFFALSYGRAQEFRATLSGQVTDPSGAVIANATITAVNVDSGTAYSAQTTKEGTYYIPYVLPGTYTVSAKAEGFKSAVQDKVRLFAAQGFGQNFKLEVGGTTERVEVTDAPPELETTSGSGGQLMLEREIEAVPLNGRSVYSLIQTTPGSQGGSGTVRSWDVSNGYNIGGGATGFNQFTLNGINITQQTGFLNQSSGAWSVSPNLDTVSEVNVMTTNYDARFGRTAGGTMNIVSKAGGNKFHGDVLEMYGGALLEANTYQNNIQGVPRQGYVENHYDGTAGGPIFKNKLFFFFGFEGYNISTMNNVEMNVAPAYLRPGFDGNPGVNFGLAATMDPSHFGPGSSQPAGISIYQPGTSTCPISEGTTAQTCSNNNDLYQTPFANDTIPESQLNNTALAVLKYIPLPNIKGAENFAHGYNYYSAAPHLIHYYQPSIRVDYNLSDKTKLYSYYEWQTGKEDYTTNGLSGIAANGDLQHVRENWAATQDVTHVFSPTMVLDAKVSFSRFMDVNPDGNASLAQSPSAIGLSMPLPDTTSVQNFPEFTVSDGYTGGLNGNNSSNNKIFGNSVGADATTNILLDADLTWTKGAHNFHIGGTASEFQYGDWNLGGHANGDFNFGTTFTQYNPTNSGCQGNTPGSTGNKCNSNVGNGSSLADFYLGYPDGGGIDWYSTNAESEPTYAIYAQDDWRVNHRLTLNLGIRYDVQRGLRDRHNALDAGMCLTCVNPVTNDPTYLANVAITSNIAAWQAAGIDPTTLKNVLGGQLFPGVNGQSRDAYYTDWGNIGPRVGFAYALNPKTVVRGGWGIVYEGGLEGGSSAGFDETTNYINSRDGNITPNSSFKSGAPFAGVSLIKPVGSADGLLSNVGNGNQAFDFPGRKMPRAQVFSLGLQRELPGKIVVDARYAANYASKLRTFLWLTAAKTTLSDFNAAIANPNLWTELVPNPYYNVSAAEQGGTGCATTPTVWALALKQPLSQYCGGGGSAPLVGEYNAPLGRNWYNGLEVKASRHVYGESRGLFFEVAYTWSKTINGDGYPFGWPFQGAAAPTSIGITTNINTQVHVIASNDRAHILAITPVWDLPIGKGSLFFPNPPKIADYVISGWTLSSVTMIQSGQPVGLNNGWQDSCPLSAMRPAHGTSTREWLKNDIDTINTCWHQIPNVDGMTMGLQTTPQQFTGERQPTVPNVDLSLQKSTPLWNNTKFILRLDALNAFNSPLFGGPDSNPGDGVAQFVPGQGWSGFGTVGTGQNNNPRIVKVSGKITF